MSLNFNNRNQDEVKVPTPQFKLIFNKATFGQNHGNPDLILGPVWQYKGINKITGVPQTDIKTFSNNAYTLFGGIELNDILPGLINGLWQGTDYNFLNYQPQYILYCKKRTGRYDTKHKWSRIVHLNGTHSRFSNVGTTGIGYTGFDFRESIWNMNIDLTNPNKNAGKLTPLNIQAKHYVKCSGSIDGLGNSINGYGQNIFPISEQNWHNNNNLLGTQFGTRGAFRTFFRTGGFRQRMNSKKFEFKIAIEIVNPLDNTKRISSSLSSNTLIIQPESGIFFDSANGGQVDKYFYTWNISIK